MQIETNFTNNEIPSFDNVEQQESYIKYKIVVLRYDFSLSIEKIAKKVGKSKSAVHNILERFQKFANVHHTEYSKCGRKEKISDDEVQQFIFDKLKENDQITQNEIASMVSENFGISVSQKTISNFLKNCGSYYKKLEIPILSDKNKKKRIDYSVYHHNDKFTNVVFSDESRFQLFTNNKKVFVRKGDARPFVGKPNPNYSIMVWGAICRKGKVGFKILDSTMKVKNMLKF